MAGDWSWKPSEKVQKQIKRGEARFIPRKTGAGRMEHEHAHRIADQLQIQIEADIMKKTLPQTALPKDFKLTDKTISIVEMRYPTVDIEASLERFIETAEAGGWMYADWQAGFKTCIRKGVDNGWNSIVRFKEGRAQDPRWKPILSEVEPYGFRKPSEAETPEGYRTAFEQWKKTQNQSRSTGAVDIRGALRALR